MAISSTYPTTIDSLPTQDVENPEVSAAVTQVETLHQPQLLGQAVAFGATVTPDPRLGELVTVGALTGAITIANPPAGAKQVGRKLTLVLTQDGTGGRAVTWGADYANAPSTANDKIGAVRVVTFVWDGTHWVCKSNTLPSKAVTGALSTVADAPAKAVLTSLIGALVANGLATDGTT